MISNGSRSKELRYGAMYAIMEDQTKDGFKFLHLETTFHRWKMSIILRCHWFDRLLIGWKSNECGIILFTLPLPGSMVKLVVVESRRTFPVVRDSINVKLKIDNRTSAIQTGMKK